MLVFISTHAPAGGATGVTHFFFRMSPFISTHAPAGGATAKPLQPRYTMNYFYSRPCGRGDATEAIIKIAETLFLLTPLREGRHADEETIKLDRLAISTHAPAGGATKGSSSRMPSASYFYSRPCGRGDRARRCRRRGRRTFLLTPLREGRRLDSRRALHAGLHFYSRPCGRGDVRPTITRRRSRPNFYSRPCGRGDTRPSCRSDKHRRENFYSRPCGRGDERAAQTCEAAIKISTHAPAGGATCAVRRTVSKLS